MPDPTKPKSQQYLEQLSAAIVKAEILCPRCPAYDTQPLMPVGDHPETLFCPHCMLDLDLRVYPHDRWDPTDTCYPPES